MPLPPFSYLRTYISSLMDSTIPNGHSVANDEDPQAIIEQLREELRKTREEKDDLAAQHHNLVSKVSNIRNTLGAKLKQDAVTIPLRLRDIAA